MTKYTIDAQGKKLGRVATEAAAILIGKQNVDFAKNDVADVTVEIINAGKADISVKKAAETMHETYSGYPGGIKFKSTKLIASQKGYSEIFKLAVEGMLPKNKLQKQRMKNLIVKE